MRLPRRLAVLLAVPALLAAAAFASPPAPEPASGVHSYNAPVCGRAWVPVDLGRGDYFNVYNQQDRGSCISAERYHLAWVVASRRSTVSAWQYPNISSGWEWGRYTCDDGRSALPSARGSRCMRYPVQVRRDGAPLTSVSYWPHLADGNVAYDIWFNRTDAHPGQDNGAEIMIWLDHPGVGTWSAGWHVTIGGIGWSVMNWVAYRGGVHWNYVAFVADHPVRVLPPVWLNEFFRSAERHGQLSPDWWLTAIDFGSEINVSQGTGPGFAVHSYSLTGVR